MSEAARADAVPSRTLPERAAEIAGPAGRIQSAFADPGAVRRAFALVCHPHPLYGGTMNSKVVVTTARALHELGIATVRFNFRGVGNSEGAFDQGIGEIDDANAVLRWARERWSSTPEIYAGFSFGAFIALKLALAQPPAELITIAPPVTRFAMQGLNTPDCPWLIVQGDADDIVSLSEVKRWREQLTPPPDLSVVPGAGHFFHGMLMTLKDTLTAHVRRVLAQSEE